jgi:hypothetical protein
MHERFALAFAIAAFGKIDEMAVSVTPHTEHRVNDKMDGDSFRIKRHADGIDEERHVVVDDLDDRVARVPAFACRGARVKRAQFRFAGGTLLRELPERQRRAEEILRVATGKIVGRDTIVELRDEALEKNGFAGVKPRRREVRDRSEERRFFGVRALRHV